MEMKDEENNKTREAKIHRDNKQTEKEELEKFIRKEPGQRDKRKQKQDNLRELQKIAARIIKEKRIV